MATAIGNPMADHSEKRPPTQSQKPKVVVMPKAAAASTCVVVATKCLAMSVPPSASNHARASCALAMVSWVAKVLLATMNSVSAGFSRRSTLEMSCPST